MLEVQSERRGGGFEHYTKYAIPTKIQVAVSVGNWLFHAGAQRRCADWEVYLKLSACVVVEVSSLSQYQEHTIRASFVRM